MKRNTIITIATIVIALPMAVLCMQRSHKMTLPKPQTQAPQELNPPNRLRDQTSPYLLQHANNPVDWYPWGPEAFAAARRQDKPIFLSIGYSTCHWCHVMAHESFEDPQVARLLNDAFIAIKVDREERPDIDNIYMSVCQTLTGSGGWPLTIFMTPDQKPFYAATYIPRDTRFGHIGMVELLPAIEHLWLNSRSELQAAANRIITTLQQQTTTTPGPDLTTQTLTKAYNQLTSQFDPTQGGFSKAPKFPTPSNLTFLLRYHHRTKDPQALAMVETTLQAMRRGGIYDHLAFGFHRYATDDNWLIPHFEKMLYDQALLTIAYIETAQTTAKTQYADTARQIITYVLQEMTSPQGAFYSAQDADSEGVEGKFYFWTESQIKDVLPPDQADLIIKVFNIKPSGNFPAPAQDPASNILHLTKPISALAAELNLPEQKLRQTIEKARQTLLTARQKRIPPHTDKKILTDWNSLMIAALAKAARYLDEPTYTKAAQRAANFILTQLQDTQGRLLHTKNQTANVDDYAFFIWALLELYQTTFDITYLQSALTLNTQLIDNYWDPNDAGFYFTPDHGEKLILRPIEIYDGATPSGNSIALANLLRLARITANTDLEAKADQLAKAFSNRITNHPTGYLQLLSAVDFALGPAYEIVITGPSNSPDTTAMLTALRTRFIPNAVTILRRSEQDPPDITTLAPYTKNQTPRQNRPTAYICQNYSCKAPTNNIKKMLTLLNLPTTK